jgi:hypothetical protein
MTRLPNSLQRLGDSGIDLAANPARPFSLHCDDGHLMSHYVVKFAGDTGALHFNSLASALLALALGAIGPFLQFDEPFAPFMNFAPESVGNHGRNRHEQDGHPRHRLGSDNRAKRGERHESADDGPAHDASTACREIAPNRM